MRHKFFLVLALLIIAGFLFLTFGLAQVDTGNQSQAQKGVSYLRSQPFDAWSLMALTSAGETNLDLSFLQSVNEKTALGYAKYILALTAVGKNPTNFGNENYVEKLKGFYQNNQFGDVNLLNDDIWAILALGALGQDQLGQVQASQDYILSHQNIDGGWGYSISATSDTNDTAAAIMALKEAGAADTSGAVQRATAYLKSTQNEDGGFPYSAGSVSDSCSDAWVISAVYKLQQDPFGSAWFKNGHHAVQSLQSLQDTDGGFWWQKSGDNKFCTSFAVVALLGKFYPVATDLNLHHLRIEGENTICDAQVNGATALDLISSGALQCGFNYNIKEFSGLGLYLDSIGHENNWMYLVNGLSPQVGADNYFLDPNDEVVWYSGEWLEEGWFLTKLIVSQADQNIKIQTQFLDPQQSAWQDLKIEALKIKIGSSDFTTNALGAVEINQQILADGLYPVFLEKQVVQGRGYLRSPKENLKIGIAPMGHQAQLVVNIEKLPVPPESDQSIISFSVSPDQLDFGTLRPGQQSSTTLSINNGSMGVFLEAEVVGSGIFRDNLSIAGLRPNTFSLELTPNKSQTLPLQLSIPLSYQGNFGLNKGEITFWAIKQ
ncbi:MAG: prenyltransferase/squalene oxidase repeat-containing protein [Candidatus Pacebacteria bacterium]|nr:prenyltransferase/squalene oxidase repeat-containing protein [Candidatus Paceibacterota bacterium]